MKVRFADGGELDWESKFPPAYGHYTLQLAIYHAGLRFFGFEPGDVAYGEPNDWSLARRMAAAGVRFGKIDELVCIKYEDRPTPKIDPLTAEVPFVDLDAARADLGGELEAAVAGCWHRVGTCSARSWSASRPSSPTTAASPYCVGVGNGLDALELSLRAAGIGPGDEVIVPAYTCRRQLVGGDPGRREPGPGEPDPETISADPAAAAAPIPRTAAIVPVPCAANSADMDPIRELATDRGLFLLEDAAQAHGARRAAARRVVGDATGFSFYPSKNLGVVGDGGAVTTSDAASPTSRMLRNYGPVTATRSSWVGRTRGLTSCRRRPCGRSCPGWTLERRPGGARRALRRRLRGGRGDHPAAGGRALRAGLAPLRRRPRRARSRPRRARRGGRRNPRPLSAAAPPLPRLRRPRAAARQLPVSERLADEVLSLPMHPFVGAGAERVIAGLRAAVGA